MKREVTASLAPPIPRSSAGPAWLLVTVSLGGLLAPLNSTMVAVALPDIRRDFDISHAAVGWLVSSYLIAMAVTQPIGGRLGDKLGRMPVFRAGLLGFVVFSVASTLAPTFPVLLVSRLLQAVSGAILIPNGLGILREAVPVARFGRYSGWNGAVIGATAAAGPVLGGAVLAFSSWRPMFLVSLPVVAAALIMSVRLPGGRTAGGRAAIDWIGAALFVAVLCMLTAMLNVLESGGTALVLSAASLAALVAIFVWRQTKTPAPAAEWRLFRQRSFVGASSHILLMNLAMYTTLLAVPFFVTDVQGHSSAVAGVLLGCMATLQAISAPLSGRAADAVGRRKLTLTSSFVSLVAAALLVGGVSRDMATGYLAGVMVLLGLGVGIGFVAATAAAIEAAPKALAGSAAGTQSMMRYLGSIIGAGILMGLLDTHGGTAPGIGVFRLLFGVVAAMVALSLVAAAMVRPFGEER